mmetsp:Transcript_76420/g.168834  ORF Transcript_76420/g.168834 Transcript_76420/m.168834 type:complete len:241 (-) Transcript_76420:137-859(-)
MVLQPSDDHVALGILPRMQDLPVVEQVKELPTIDLVEGNENTQVGILLTGNPSEEILRGQQEDSGDPFLWKQVLHLALGRSHHGEGLAAARLAVREASALCLVEHSINHRLHATLVERLVGHILIKSLVEEEIVLLNVLGEVHLQFRFPHDHSAFPAHHHVLLRGLHLALVHGPLSHHHAEPRSTRRGCSLGFSGRVRHISSAVARGIQGPASTGQGDTAGATHRVAAAHGTLKAIGCLL